MTKSPLYLVIIDKRDRRLGAFTRRAAQIVIDFVTKGHNIKNILQQLRGIIDSRKTYIWRTDATKLISDIIERAKQVLKLTGHNAIIPRLNEQGVTIQGISQTALDRIVTSTLLSRGQFPRMRSIMRLEGPPVEYYHEGALL